MPCRPMPRARSSRRILTSIPIWPSRRDVPRRRPSLRLLHTAMQMSTMTSKQMPMLPALMRRRARTSLSSLLRESRLSLRTARSGPPPSWRASRLRRHRCFRTRRIRFPRCSVRSRTVPRRPVALQAGFAITSRAARPTMTRPRSPRRSLIRSMILRTRNRTSPPEMRCSAPLPPSR